MDVATEAAAAGTTTTLPCITQDPRERQVADPDYLQVCTGVGQHIVNSVMCEGTGCGGHMICTPCRDLAEQKGWLT